MEVSSCTRKVSYMSERSAWGGALLGWVRHGTKLKPYRCEWCREWHCATDRSGEWELDEVRWQAGATVV